MDSRDRGPGWERRNGKLIYRASGLPSAYVISEAQLRRLQPLFMMEILAAVVTGLPILGVMIDGIGGGGMDWVLLLVLLVAFGVLNQALWFYLRRRRLNILQGAPVAADTPPAASVSEAFKTLWQSQSNCSLSLVTWLTGVFAFLCVVGPILLMAGVLQGSEPKTHPLLVLLFGVAMGFVFFLCLKERRRRRHFS